MKTATEGFLPGDKENSEIPSNLNFVHVAVVAIFTIVVGDIVRDKRRDTA